MNKILQLFYIAAGKPTKFAPNPKPAPCLAVKPTEGLSKSKMAKTTAATVDTTRISSTLGTLRGMITIATATARPSKKYLMARVSNSVAEKPSIVSYIRGGEKKRAAILHSGTPGVARSSLKINVTGFIRTTMSETEVKESYLEADKEIPGQHYVCLSFVSPQKVLKNKDIYFFSEFLKDYEIQYKIKATETFLMSQASKLQETASKVQDMLENALAKPEASADLSGALALIKETRASLVTGTAADLEAHVKKEMADFKTSSIQEAYETFLFKQRKRLEDEFFAKNNFRTTVQGLKVRGSYDTYNEAVARAKALQKIDPIHNVYVAQVGFWVPWDPEPHEVADQEYADDQLNTLMKKYKENEQERETLYNEQKISRMGNKGAKTITGAGVGAASNVPANEMFGGEDLAIARKREAASK